MTNDPIDVTSFGAQGDGASDDRAAIILALASAMAHGLPLYFRDGTYAISGYLDIYGARNLTIYGSGNATLFYPSDNTALVADGIALTSAIARSALRMRHCQRTLIERLRFHGGESRDIDVANVGSGVYERSCQQTTIRGCHQLFGGSLHRLDGQTDTTGTGDSMAVSNGLVTLTDSTGDFTPGDVGLQLTISGGSNPATNPAHGYRELLQEGPTCL
jgi:polygalacturonase